LHCGARALSKQTVTNSPMIYKALTLLFALPLLAAASSRGSAFL
jgi:hypothetical protein